MIRGGLALLANWHKLSGHGLKSMPPFAYHGNAQAVAVAVCMCISCIEN